MSGGDKQATISMTTTSLDMTARPTRSPRPPPALNQPAMFLRAERPTISFYRYLYNTVGAQWLWYERRSLDDEALGAIIHDERVFINVLHVGGVPAGFIELDCRDHLNIEVAYLGLIPEFIGRGLGWRLIDWALESAWDREPDRVWIHTCNLDHPSALSLYQKAGFTPFAQETIDIPNPWGTLGFPPSV